MLNRPIVIKVLELTKEDVESKQQALDLGLPMPEVFGKETDAYFYSIDPVELLKVIPLIFR